MKLGIVGLPNVGKSTLFNALTAAGADVANYPFCTIEPNVGIVPVPDPRLDHLAEIFKPKKKTPATVTFVDIAGLVEGASKGEGLGNKFLGNIRECDAIVHMVRAFKDENVTHVYGNVDVIRDVKAIETELILADYEQVERRLQKVEKQAKSGEKKARQELEVLAELLKHLDQAKPARQFALGAEHPELMKELFLLSNKPILYLANIAESELGQELAELAELKAYAAEQNAEVISLCSKVEADLQALEPDERELFMADLGLSESGLDQVIKAAYSLLGYISYFTTGEDECRAWTIVDGTLAPQAAGKIHSDFERGFIRAECINYEKFVNEAECSLVKAKERGLYRSEGKDYLVKDGDMLLFRFNV
ncbi:MAG: redox-regulated ATPase YchF [Eubacteriales bacterium]|nr:redox-regulated ATPase YchF [Eubacteriales bacterium]